MANRKPVGYQRKFIDAYTPNQTDYLPEALKTKLSEMSNQHTKEDSPSGTFAKSIFNRLMIDLSWNSSRLEGNTYSLLETQALLDFNQASPTKSPMETQMLLNHKAAIEFLVDSAEIIKINSFTICNLHALLSENLLGNPNACGRIRRTPVGIYKTAYHPLEIPQQIDEIFHLILHKAEAIKNPFEQSFFLMVHLPYLQAFEDVNKRTSRLATNIPLIKHNLCPISFVEVNENLYISGNLGVYELNKIELLCDFFLWAYERSCLRYAKIQHVVGEPDQFKLQYRNEIAQLIKLVIQQNLQSQGAIKEINTWTAKQIPAQDQLRFIEVVETEIMSLHVGNIARFQITEAEFSIWKNNT